MRLLEDRFVVHDAGPAIDLATGAPVTVKIAAAGAAAEQLQWTLRCDRWRTVQHRAFARLLDFGLTGDAGRFEAWQCGAPWAGARDEIDRVCHTANEFLRAAGMTIGQDLGATVHTATRGPIVVPDTGTGYPHGSDEPVAASLPIERRGLILIPRPALAALGEMAEQGDRSRSRVAVLWGPAGSGKAIALQELARIARINGFVPIASQLLDAPYASLWQGRSLFIMATNGPASAWTAALQSALRSPRPHVVLIVSEHELRGVDGVRLAPVDADTLAASVFPRTDDAAQVRRIRRAAERARGLPGRFVRLLWHRLDYDQPSEADPAATRGLRVAESSAVYGDAAEMGTAHVAGAQQTYPASGELAALRKRIEVAQELIDRGRHRPGLRQLLHAVGSLARRDQWDAAADGAQRAAACLLMRGRPRDARAALDEARQYAARAQRDAVLVDVATLTGEAWIDLARLDEAEAVLAAAATSARGLKDTDRVANTALSLARCMYWRGQYAEAASTLAELGDRRPGGILRSTLLAARVAIGRNQFERATELTTQAVAEARAADAARGCAAASYCAAFVRLAIGDIDVADRDLVDAMAAAKAGRDPLRAARIRLLQAEVERRRGRHGLARARLERIRRRVRTLPPLLQARADLLRAVLEAGDPDQAEHQVSRLVAATGLGALTLYVGGFRARGPGAEPIETLASEVIAIVRACQTAADEAVVLKDVCARVRHQIHAAAVGFVAGPTARYAALASVGPRLDTSAAERAVTAGITIAPHRRDDRVEAAVPVRYGGALIGALCARWTLGSTHDIRRAAITLEMAAAAAAPIVSAFVSRRDVSVHTGTELIGITTAMVDLRRAIERAASAPFPVFIEGESGSGKELVARAIHRLGPRRDRTFCTLNCAALPDDLVEAELFGHTRGAFTGALVERAGVFEEAHGGTLFLDEIGELSPRAQAKVLRVIQEGELRRVGENLPRRVDVRIIAATNRDLQQDVDAGRFRTDLWYRLDVIRVSVPPLRERREDIQVLAEHFWREANQRLGGRATLGAATVAALARYDWPGNVRELQNVLAALAVRSPRRGVVPTTALPPQFGPRDEDEAWRFDDARQAFEERFVRAALVRSGGHRGRAATELGVSRQGLTKLMTRLGIADDDTSTSE